MRNVGPLVLYRPDPGTSKGFRILFDDWIRKCSGSDRLSSGPDGNPFRDEFAQPVDRHRRAEQVPLGELASKRLQGIQLALLLDAFSHGAKRQ